MATRKTEANRSKTLQNSQKSTRHSSRADSETASSYAQSTSKSTSNSGKDSDSLEALAIALIAVAAVSTLTLALSEGLRYDGWVYLPEDYPIHLFSKEGTEEVVPLYALTTSDLVTTQTALIDENLDLGMVFLGRAPLDRKGLTWQMDAGYASILASKGTFDSGFTARLRLGWFPHQQFGILPFMGILPTTDKQDLLAFQYGLEARWMPVTTGKMSFGPSLQAGYLSILGTQEDLGGFAMWAGAVLEVELVTRLSFLIRGDVCIRLESGVPTGPPAFSATAGLAIY